MADQRIELSLRKKITYSLIVFLIFLFVFSTVVSICKSIQLYYDTKQNNIWVGRIHAPNPKYGFVTVPNSFGYELFSSHPKLNYNRKIPVKYDENGFRVPVKEEKSTEAKNRPLILALGCSYTYGAKVLATEAYPYLVGVQLNGRSINAGVSAYGLTQILLKAQELIPKYKPDYVLLQYSPWLLDRAQSYFVPTRFGTLPQPFLYEESSKVKIHPPVFLTKVNKVELGEYTLTNPSIAEYISFMFKTVIPTVIYDSTNLIAFNVNKCLRLIPKPIDNKELIADFVYKEISDLANENGSKLIIVGLGGIEPLYIPPSLSQLPNTTIINTYPIFLKGIMTSNEYYIKYCHIRGNNPPVLIDIHPNAYAHKIIANTVVKKIKQTN